MMSPAKKCRRESTMAPSYANSLEMLMGDLERHDQDKKDIGQIEKSKQTAHRNMKNIRKRKRRMKLPP
jgi:hypothetical protein